jgi:formate C-acetyltransferase
MDKSLFYLSCLTVCDAFSIFAERYGAHAEALASAEKDQSISAGYAEVAKVCRHVASKPAETLHQALQTIWFAQLMASIESGTAAAFGFGRMDQYLAPYYERDVQAGVVTPEEAQELLECLWVKLNFFGGNNDSLRNISLAGQTPDGKDACNELTYMCLEASAKIMLAEPKLNVRFFKGTPRKLLLECCRVKATGMNNISIFNDEVVVPAMSRLKIPIEDVRDYCNDGCSELIIGGKGTIGFSVYDSIMALRETVLESENHEY